MSLAAVIAKRVVYYVFNCHAAYLDIVIIFGTVHSSLLNIKDVIFLLFWHLRIVEGFRKRLFCLLSNVTDSSRGIRSHAFSIDNIFH